MTEKELIRTVTKLEGKKHQSSVGDVREIWKILKQLDLETDGAIAGLLTERRMKWLRKK